MKSELRRAQHRPDSEGRLARWLPGIVAMRQYRFEWLRHDLMAGVALCAVLAPTALAYSAAAGMPAVSGLYASLAALLAYAVFGPSRILVLGPDSALVALIAASMTLVHASGPQAVAVGSALALLSGAMCVAVGLLKLGFVTDLLSAPIRYGYLNGTMLTITVGQLPKLLGFGAHDGSFVAQLSQLVIGIFAGKMNGTALVIGVSSIVVIVACRRWWPKVPGVLIAVVGATIAVSVFDLAHRSGVAVVGALPQGLPTPYFPKLALGEWLALCGSAAAIALVSFTDISMLSRTYELRGGVPVDRNQEFVALGMANLVSAFTQGFPVSASGSRTPVAEAAGAKTQATGVTAALIVAGLLMFAPRVLSNTPQATLAAVVIVASVALLEIGRVRQLYTLRRSEFVQCLVCLFGVVLLGVVNGVAIALALAVLAFLWRAWRPYAAVLGRVDGVKGYHDISRHPDARRIPGLVLLRWDAPLFFANTEIFHDRVLQVVRDAPTQIHWIVIAAEPVTDIDVTAADMLVRLLDELREMHVNLCFAEMKGPVKDSLKRYGLFARIGEQNFAPTIGRAVARYLEAERVDWHDWEDDERD
jgi:high affinity sulfate transporter 1